MHESDFVFDIIWYDVRLFFYNCTMAEKFKKSFLIRAIRSFVRIFHYKEIRFLLKNLQMQNIIYNVLIVIRFCIWISYLGPDNLSILSMLFFTNLWFCQIRESILPIIEIANLCAPNGFLKLVDFVTKANHKKSNS